MRNTIWFFSILFGIIKGSDFGIELISIVHLISIKIQNNKFVNGFFREHAGNQYWNINVNKSKFHSCTLKCNQIKFIKSIVIYLSF